MTMTDTVQPADHQAGDLAGAGVALDDAQYCTFLLGDLFLGVPVTRVQEVIRDQERTRVPLVSSVVHGLINLRGEIVTTIDLRPRLRLPLRPPGVEPVHVVVRHDDGVMSLLADEIGDVFEATDAEFEALPSTVDAIAREFVRGIFKVDQRLLLILDVERVLDVGDVTSAAPAASATLPPPQFAFPDHSTTNQRKQEP